MPRSKGSPVTGKHSGQYGFLSCSRLACCLSGRRQLVQDALSFWSRPALSVLDGCERTSQKPDEVEANDDNAEDLQRSLEAALVCLSTFDVDGVYLEKVLGTSDDIATFLECSMRTAETLSAIHDKDFTVKVLFLRWARLSQRAFQILAASRNAKEGLDIAIKGTWEFFRKSDNGWDLCGSWVTTNTPAILPTEPTTIHFDLLHAELLINGKPLSRLPIDIEAHSQFRDLFGQHRLDVYPLRTCGMQYVASGKFHGNKVSIDFNESADQEGDLLVRTGKGDRCYFLVPRRLLAECLPQSLADQCVHWHREDKDHIEFRSLREPWAIGICNWQLEKRGSMWTLARQDGAVLINPESSTAIALSEIFQAIENPSGLHIFYHAAARKISIHIPRFHLDFTIEVGTTIVRSHQFRSMHIDRDQSFATLLGLQNRLVLCHENQAGHRMILVPEGDVKTAQWQVQADVYHRKVKVDLSSAKRIQPFQLDQGLGRLVGNGTVQSKLFLAHLHAVTSFCLPDPFTGLTGTEQALRILQSAEVRSFDYLSADNIDRLCEIAAVSPKRRFYSNEEPAVEIVSCMTTALSQLCEHPGLYLVVKALFVQAAETRFFHPQAPKIPDLATYDCRLMERHGIRFSAFCGAGFGAESHTTARDQVYGRKARPFDQAKMGMAYRACRILVSRKRLLLDKPCPKFIPEIKKVLGKSGVRGPVSSLPDTEFQYDLKWLKDPTHIMGDLFCLIHKSLSLGKSRFNRFRLMLWIMTLVFAENSNESLVQVLLAFISLPTMANVQIPGSEIFHLHKGKDPLKKDLQSAAKDASIGFAASPEAQMPQRHGENAKDCNTRRKNEFNRKMKEATEDLVAVLNERWAQYTGEPPKLPKDAPYARYFNHERAVAAAHGVFVVCKQNEEFFAYIKCLRDTLKSVKDKQPAEVPSAHLRERTSNDVREVVRFVDVVGAFERAYQVRLPRQERPMRLAQRLLDTDRGTVSSSLTELAKMLSSRAQTHQEHSYVKELRESMFYLQKRAPCISVLKSLAAEKITRALNSHLKDCESRFDSALQVVLEAVDRGETTDASHLTSAKMVSMTYHWPRLPPSVILEQINCHNRHRLPGAWLERIVDLGQRLTLLQQARRFIRLSEQEIDFVRELQNEIAAGWYTEKHPDTLLLEIEGDVQVRRLQEDIARLMRDPPQGRNIVLQLNMGEGKSSVILPIAATSMADGCRLSRIIVAKPQSRQTFAMLLASLGGLVSRRIYHMPFFRGLRVGEDEVEVIWKMLKECVQSHGVILLQPEHILSLQLLAVERHITAKEKDTNTKTLRRRATAAGPPGSNKQAVDVEQKLLDILHFCNQHSRDIVDESDENFSPKFELIYTMGKQRSLEFAPYRWLITQEVLGLVTKFAPEVQQSAPTSLEIDGRYAHRVPRIRVLVEAASHELCQRIAEHICRTGLVSFAVGRVPGETKEAIIQFITKKDLSKGMVARVECSEVWSQSTKNSLLVLRGLFAEGVLSFALSQKRWSVYYGLDRERIPRTALAVPYRAKGVPARSEFSQPELQIVLTCLSYYYGGLSDDDLALALEHVANSDQADHEYAAWTSGTSLPQELRSIDGINMRDREQCLRTLFPILRYSKGAIDYFLARIVFPREMKEFPHKLSASGWDIGRAKAHSTTAFSGTNDNQHLLPLEMSQHEVPSQKHTNALVLNNLLSEDNKVVLLSELGHAGVCTSGQLLEVVTNINPQPRVILDVGAQILELTNEQVAKAWLELLEDRDHIQAAVFCNDTDDLTVVDRQGRIEPLQVSPFAKQMDVCVVFLDEAHCRGINLSLPKSYQAVVTLGAKVTKDRLAQGKPTLLNNLMWRGC